MVTKAQVLYGVALVVALTGCQEGGGSDVQDGPISVVRGTGIGALPDALDQQLRPLIEAAGVSANPAAGRSLPSISDPLPQLGMQLFFSKSLGGDFDAACVSCHHPALGGADRLSLSVGTSAVNPDLLGPGREAAGGEPLVPRNAPTTFNAGLWDRGLFLDSRVESLNPTAGANGSAGGIRTPDSPFGVADTNAGDNLPSAQARFPVTEADEMRGTLESVGSNDTVRNHLAARLGNYAEGTGELSTNHWLAEFQSAYGSTASAPDLITFANIAHAIGEYERSQVFVDNPWNDYVAGDLTAISAAAKRGAILFYTPAPQGGGGCSGCHSGDLFSDERFHAIAFPQIGPGKGDGNNDDFGRERETGVAADRYRFRTPSLLNVALTAPYGHSGAYATLREVLRHYNNPNGSVTQYFDNGGWCRLLQFAAIPGCATLYPDARDNSDLALQKLAADRRNGAPGALPNIRLNNNQQQDIIAFLDTLTDRCAADTECIAQWVPGRDGGPDNQQLNAIDENGSPL